LKWWEAVPDKVWMAFFIFWMCLWAILDKIFQVAPDSENFADMSPWVETWAQAWVRDNKEVLDRMAED